ncbi:hypothetical protein FM996_15610 [Methylosinus sporium]|uniref:Outer membrane assembly lipoprotein YfiO n=1 Tax=Methylosinus sporium TaxID=428 RepID=A0A549SM97_METSR|nr:MULTISPECIES: hypothetical protein [Methylosinus]MBU3887344.1 hypothetical protein [Methylosinus sp. KRF6]TRL30758.1 hypothetical protein FM996_15610 [Methylosinus sporium]
MRPLLSAAFCLVFLIVAGAARACGGGDPSPERWALDQKGYAGLGAMPFLNPANDSRLNLLFLMIDGDPKLRPEDEAVSKGVEKIDFYSSVLFPRPDFTDACRTAAAARRGKDGAQSAFADGEGSRCVSMESGRIAFAAAVEAEPALSAEERRALTAARAEIAPSCRGEKPDAAALPAALAQIAPSAATAQEFASYLAGADAFYEGDFDSALARFGKLDSARNAWLREAARYMTARALLNKAQIGAFADFDGTAAPNVTDRATLTAAQTAFQTYLKSYPAGRYAASAQGLLRRVYWLAADEERLAAEYGRQIAQESGARTGLDGVDLVQEIDAKYLTAAKDHESRDPILLATQDLMKLRADGAEKSLSAAALDAEASVFAGREELFGFLKAARAYYADRDFSATLQALGAPNATPRSYVAFSREVLRGQALMASGQFPAAIEHWTKLRGTLANPLWREAVELGLAMSYERAGMANKVFLPETRLASPRIRAILLRHTAGPILLRMAVADPQASAEERKLARFLLLYKEATRGQYANFLRDFSPEGLAEDDAAAPDVSDLPKSAIFLSSPANESYKCPAPKAVVAELAADPRSSHGLLCLGDFVRRSGFAHFDAWRPAADELGGAKAIFPGEPFSRGDVYQRLIADPATKDADRAYALYRAINCYAPAGSNDCGGKDVDKAQRKAWFQTLKSRYGATQWARGLQYYW